MVPFLNVRFSDFRLFIQTPSKPLPPTARVTSLSHQRMPKVALMFKLTLLTSLFEFPVTKQKRVRQHYVRARQAGHIIPEEALTLRLVSTFPENSSLLQIRNTCIRNLDLIFSSKTRSKSKLACVTEQTHEMRFVCMVCVIARSLLSRINLHKLIY